MLDGDEENDDWQQLSQVDGSHLKDKEEDTRHEDKEKDTRHEDKEKKGTTEDEGGAAEEDAEEDEEDQEEEGQENNSMDDQSLGLEMTGQCRSIKRRRRQRQRPVPRRRLALARRLHDAGDPAALLSLGRVGLARPIPITTTTTTTPPPAGTTGTLDCADASRSDSASQEVGSVLQFSGRRRGRRPSSLLNVAAGESIESTPPNHPRNHKQAESKDPASSQTHEATGLLESSSCSHPPTRHFVQHTKRLLDTDDPTDKDYVDHPPSPSPSSSDEEQEEEQEQDKEHSNPFLLRKGTRQRKRYKYDGADDDDEQEQEQEGEQQDRDKDLTFVETVVAALGRETYFDVAVSLCKALVYVGRPAEAVDLLIMLQSSRHLDRAMRYRSHWILIGIHPFSLLPLTCLFGCLFFCSAFETSHISS